MVSFAAESHAATTISVNFNGRAHDPSFANFATYPGDNLTAGETAGLVPARNWNNITNGNNNANTSGNLNDSAGAPTGVTMAWTSNDSWNTGNALPLPAWTTGDEHMSFGVIKAAFTVGETGTLSFLGLPAQGFTFSLYAYTTVNNPNNGLALTVNDDANQGRYYTQAQGLKSSWTDEGTNTTPGVFTDTGDHAIFNGTKSSGNLVLSFRYANAGANADGVGITGVQLIYTAVPEPSSLLMGGLALMGFAQRRRRA